MVLQCVHVLLWVQSCIHAYMCVYGNRITLIESIIHAWVSLMCADWVWACLVFLHKFTVHFFLTNTQMFVHNAILCVYMLCAHSCVCIQIKLSMHALKRQPSGNAETVQALWKCWKSVCEHAITTCRSVHKAVSSNFKPWSTCEWYGSYRVCLFHTYIQMQILQTQSANFKSIWPLFFLLAFISQRRFLREPVYVWTVLCLSCIMGRKEPTTVLRRSSYSITDTDRLVNDDPCFVPGSVPIMHQSKITW